MTTEVLRSLDFPVLFDDHHETFTTNTIPKVSVVRVFGTKSCVN